MQIVLDIPDKTVALTVTIVEPYKACVEAYNHAQLKEISMPCALCRFNPPSSRDGKPCSYCPAEGGAS